MINEEIIFDSTVTGSAVSSISTGSILNGDVDGWYTIILMSVGSGANGSVYCQPNGDTGNNMGRRQIYASSTTVVNQSATTDAISFMQGGDCGTGYISFQVAKLYAKSGAVRLLNSTTAGYISGTTIDNIKTHSSVWNNTVDNIVSLVFKHTASNFGIGTRVIILRPVTNTGGKKWVEVGSSVLGAPASSVTLSGLNGDVDQVYMLDCQIKANGAAGDLAVKLNNDGTTSNYGYQLLTGTSTTVSASRATTSTGYYGGSASTNAYYATLNMIIYAKQGFLRPAIANIINNITGTTVSTIYTMGQSYSVTNTNVTSIVIAETANNFDTGSQFKLYALRP